MHLIRMTYLHIPQVWRQKLPALQHPQVIASSFWWQNGAGAPRLCWCCTNRWTGRPILRVEILELDYVRFLVGLATCGSISLHPIVCMEIVDMDVQVDIGLKKQSTWSEEDRGLPREATDTILFCNSIVHEIVYKAAEIAIQREEHTAERYGRKKELVTLFGLSGVAYRNKPCGQAVRNQKPSGFYARGWSINRLQR